MKRILTILSLSFAVLAIGSVSHAAPSPPEMQQLPKIKKEVVVMQASFAAPVLFVCRYDDAFAKVKQPIALAVQGYMQLAERDQVQRAPYTQRYAENARSLSNYWQGPPPYGNA